jgi:hypothetical protein
VPPMLFLGNFTKLLISRRIYDSNGHGDLKKYRQRQNSNFVVL